MWDINCQVHRRGIELVRPGVRCCDIAAELNKIYREHDLLKYRTCGHGHSMGVMCHYYGREAGWGETFSGLIFCNASNLVYPFLTVVIY